MRHKAKVYNNNKIAEFVTYLTAKIVIHLHFRPPVNNHQLPPLTAVIIFAVII